ncbi:hypothetical protein J31TS4_44860 [Paenibacillus sp. J31TS4]|uniref:tetratricopeptide repeat protein n=1 Tax=Paenibacillus sp. J31TS4 TaxID=2807195 RepID=UPI001B0A8A81|nr:tetratricopeptide repeat protein [Paenibacillus sp. J31TS4]GIP41206.1 hypothetical protein J31TS4_44860 [Paenibacillus sp. J31TS4]
MKLFANYYTKKGRRLLTGRNLPEALKAYEKVAFAKLPERDQVNVAVIHHELGRSERALELLGEVLARCESDFGYERRAHILREQDREEEALDDLEQAIRLNPDPFMYWYTRGLALKDLGRYEEATRDLEECVKREPEDSVVSTYYELGMCYYHAEQYEEAERIFRKVLTYEDKEIPIFAYRLAKVLELLGKDEEAIVYLKRAIERHGLFEVLPDSGEREIYERTSYGPGAFRTFQTEVDRTAAFRRDLAVLLLNRGDSEEGLEVVNGALERYPEDEGLYLLRANLNRQLQRWEPCASDLDRALELGGRLTDVDYQRICLFRARQQEEKVLAFALERAAEYPEHPLYRYWIADSYYRQERNEEALEANKRLLELEDDDPLNEVQRGDILKELGMYRQAEESYSRAINMREEPDFRMKRSFAYFREERYDDALLDLRRAAELDPGLLRSGSYHHAMGHILDGMGQAELALTSFSDAIRHAPGYPVYYESRARSYLEQDRLEDAERDCLAGLQADPGYSDLLSLLGYIRYRQEDYLGSRSYAKQYADLYPDSPVGYYHVGLASYRLGDQEGAEEAFDQALELAPGFGSCYLYKAYLAYDRLEFEEAIQHLANWNVCSFQELPLEERLQKLNELDGFDEEVLEGAEERIKEWYDGPVYLS